MKPCCCLKIGKMPFLDFSATSSASPENEYGRTAWLLPPGQASTVGYTVLTCSSYRQRSFGPNGNDPKAEPAAPDEGVRGCSYGCQYGTAMPRARNPPELHPR